MLYLSVAILLLSQYANSDETPDAPKDGGAQAECGKANSPSLPASAQALADSLREVLDKSSHNLMAEFQRIQHRARAISKKTGHEINPLHIRDVIAMRFINRQDWESSKAKGNTDPRNVYDPKPITWDNWQKVNDNLVEPAALQAQPLTREMVASWNQGAVLGTVPAHVKAGELKRYNNYGRNTSRDTALTLAEIQNLLSIRFEGEAKAGLGWTYLECQEDLPKIFSLPGSRQECQDIFSDAKKWGENDSFWQETRSDMEKGLYKDRWYWYACWPETATPSANSDPKQKYCGMIRYPSPDTVPARLDKILNAINTYFSSSGKTTEDPIHFAVRMQRQAVALHPFNRGNGRVSRWLMDYIMLRSNLPPILVQNMDLDISTSFDTYYRQGMAGAWESLIRMDKSLDHYKTADFSALQSTVFGLAEEVVVDALPSDAPTWEREIAAHVRVLSRDIDTYHWTSRAWMQLPVTGVVDRKTLEEKGRAFVGRYLDDFDNHVINTKAVSSAGPGLYLASDPIATAYYGGTENWALLKLPLKAKAKFLDIRRVFAKLFSEQAQNELKQAGCDVMALDAMMWQPECRPMIKKARDDLGFSFISYTYSTTQFPGFPERPATAFVLASKDGVDWPKVKTLVADVPKPDSDQFDRALIVAAWHRSIPLIKGTTTINEKKYTAQELNTAYVPWKSISGLPKEEFDPYVMTHFFGTSTYPEDKIPLSAKDFDERYAVIQTKAKALSQAKGVAIDPLRFRFLVQRFYPSNTADNPEINPASSGGWYNMVLDPVAPLGSGDVDAAWAAAGRQIRQAAIKSAKLNEPLTIETIKTWHPAGVRALSAEKLIQLERELKFTEENFHDPTATHEQIMASSYYILDQLNTTGLFKNGYATVGQALIDYIRLRAGMAPTFTERSWGRTWGDQFRKTTSDAYDKMLDCLRRWETEAPAAVQKSECGQLAD